MYRNEITTIGSVANAVLAASFVLLLFLALISPAGAVSLDGPSAYQACLAGK